ncbi:MAG: rod shape-determining protein MreD [Bacteroidales bacterium]|nr:rod shape-determining protein MreD [Bacteroidales bacterium]MBD5281769.1 rod shape-determining protein MreD [Bacteroides sp.]MDE6033405.1 rod shape-determining protein MreD [Muribaculaceae bacterium]MBD5293536.1 rod shape-determining protein MreD [Bacteroides sp.]MBD5341805.1 rod shape-determining protein MreD [Bacteroides sp.]
MSKTFLQFSVMFVVMVLLQAVICNRLVLFSVALAFVFIYFIIKLPMNISSSKVIFFSFLIGFCVDVFSDTPGMNSLACTCLGACRHTILRLYVPREDDVIHRIPGIASLGWAVFAKYVLTMSLLYCIMITLIESFAFRHPLLMVERALGSTLLTSMTIMVIDFIFSRSHFSAAK